MKTNKNHETNKELESLKGEGLLNNPDLKELIKFAQVIPDSMMQEIKRISNAKGISVELEVVSRLLATFVKPEALGIESLSDKILIRNFNAQEAFKECKANHERWVYPYEVEKLRTFLSFKTRIMDYQASHN